MTTRVCKIFTFDAAHTLRLPCASLEESEEVYGKCTHLHGHTYKLEITVEGLVDRTTGMVVNFTEISDAVKEYINEKLDHKNLNMEFPDRPTTAENLAKAIWADLTSKNPGLFEGLKNYLVKIRLWETPTSYVEIEP